MQKGATALRRAIRTALYGSRGSKRQNLDFNDTVECLNTLFPKQRANERRIRCEEGSRKDAKARRVLKDVLKDSEELFRDSDLQNSRITDSRKHLAKWKRVSDQIKVVFDAFRTRTRVRLEF